ncbi:MAG TPA: sensor histidine kinase [Candidatus Competibacteraceae bacterium]|nr:sensor histidine kinase [Candidatus Competibacteraceae bacterium]
MHPQYSPRNRAERLIAIARVLLAAFSLLAIWLDPTTPIRYADTAYGLLVAYLGYAVCIVPLAWRLDSAFNLQARVTHLFDLAVFTLLIYFTEGLTSPFFTYFVFSLLCATLRWQWWGALWTALVALTIYVGMGAYAVYVLQDPAFELHRFIIRSVYLAVLGVLMGHLGLYEHRLRSELSKLAAWPWAVSSQTLIRDLLRSAADVFNTSRVLLIWDEADEPWRYVATHFRGEFQSFREPPTAFEPPVVEPLRETHFLCSDTRDRTPLTLHSSLTGFQRWRGMPLHPELQARFGIGSVLALHLHAENMQGRLFVLDKSDMTSDDLLLGEIVARQMSTELEQRYLQRCLQQAAAMEERYRLAGDLHDGLLQSLTGMALQLQTLHRLVEEDPKAARERLQDVQDLLQLEQRNLRAFILKLKPAPLDLLGESSNLAVSLKELGSRIERYWGLPVILTLDPAISRIRQPLGHEIHRIVQEALINAARHASASVAEVEVGVHDGRVHIVVADDGRGFPFRGRYDLATLSARQMGPVALRERVASRGGQMVIDSSEAGARLDINLPLDGRGASSGHASGGSDHADHLGAGR